MEWYHTMYPCVIFLVILVILILNYIPADNYDLYLVIIILGVLLIPHGTICYGGIMMEWYHTMYPCVMYLVILVILILNYIPADNYDLYLVIIILVVLLIPHGTICYDGIMMEWYHTMYHCVMYLVILVIMILNYIP